MMHYSTTRNHDRVFDWLHGTNTTENIYRFQQCVATEGQVFFGQGITDLGGIGVLLSLTILCAICTVGCFAVIALSFALNRTFYRSILQTRHAGWISRVFSRTKDALIASLSSSHSTLLFLSLTINAASMTFFFANGCANNYSQCYQGAGQYNSLLMNWISLLTIYPCLSILNTPSLWPHLRRRRFRLLATAACIGMSGALCGTFWDEVFTSTTIDYDNPGCIVPYFHASIPRQVEARLLFASWIPCAWTLIIITVTQLEIQDYTLLTNCLPRLKQLLGLYSTQTNDSIRKESSIKEYSRVILRIKRALKYFFRIFYVTNYIYIQAQPFFHLWRIYWIRHHVRSLLQPPTQFNTLYPPFGDDEKVATELERELDNWDADKWSFGQILTLSLWCPVLMDLVYILIAGQEYGLTSRLPVHWRATKHGSPTDLASQASDTTTKQTANWTVTVCCSCKCRQVVQSDIP